MGAGDHRPPLRDPLLAPVAGQVEQLTRHLGHRQGEHTVVHGVRLVGQVGDLGLGPKHTAAEQFDTQPASQLGHRVGGVDLNRRRPRLDQLPALCIRHARAVDPHIGGLELGRPVAPPSITAQSGATRPAGPVLGEHGEAEGFVLDVVGERPHCGEDQGLGSRKVESTQVRAPVDDSRKPSVAEVEKHRHTFGAQMDHNVDARYGITLDAAQESIRSAASPQLPALPGTRRCRARPRSAGCRPRSPRAPPAC